MCLFSESPWNILSRKSIPWKYVYPFLEMPIKRTIKIPMPYKHRDFYFYFINAMHNIWVFLLNSLSLFCGYFIKISQKSVDLLRDEESGCIVQSQMMQTRYAHLQSPRNRIRIYENIAKSVDLLRVRRRWQFRKELTVEVSWRTISFFLTNVVTTCAIRQHAQSD